MNKLIIDATKNKIFLMIIINDSKHYITHENSKSNYEKLIILINELLESRNLELKKIQKIYINRGPGSFAGIRNSLSIVKALYLAQEIDYYCYSFNDFPGEIEIKYENIPKLCEKFKVKKNLINPIYMS